METNMTHENFARHVATKFQVETERGKVELELTDVSELKSTPGQEQFAIIFRGPKETFLGQGTQLFKHEQMGEFALFIVPIRNDGKGYYYEAVFNRFLKTNEVVG